MQIELGSSRQADLQLSSRRPKALERTAGERLKKRPSQIERVQEPHILFRRCRSM
jgi:hypothetical protein